MEPSVLAPWRDAAIVLLSLELMLIVLAPGIALVFAVRGIRALKRWIRAPLLQAQMWAMRIQRGTTRTGNAVAAVPITITSTGVQARVTMRALIDYVLGRGE